MPIWGHDPIRCQAIQLTPLHRFSRPRRRDSLREQVVAVNLLLVVLTLFAASVAAGFDLTIEDGRRQFLVLAWAAILSLLLNMLMLRRRFRPLEKLIEDLESIDPARPSEAREAFKAPEAASGRPIAEIERLGASFRSLLERVESERRRSGRLVLRAQEQERGRVARDLHDEVNQSLTAILVRLEAVAQGAPPELADELRDVKAVAGQAMDELLKLARQLRPAALDDHGLAAAIEGQVRRFEEQTGLPVALRFDTDGAGLDTERHTVIYRVAQEALANVARHAGARQVSVSLAKAAGGVTLEIRDDGEGFDPTAVAVARETAQSAGRAPGAGLGLEGMAERARLVGGRLMINSAPGSGTRVMLRVSA